MLKAVILNPNPSLNSFKAVGSISFVPGSNLTVNFQLQSVADNIRYIPEDAGFQIKATFNTSDDDTDNVLEKTATTPFALDRSIFQISFTQAETLILLGGAIQIEVDMLGNDAIVYKLVLRNALSREIIGSDGCC